MTTLADHARSLVAYTRWADTRILDAASAISAEQFVPLAPQLAHMLGTIRWWHGRWTGNEHDDLSIHSLADAREKYAAAHDMFETFAASLDEDGWHRGEQWWKPCGYDQSAPVGEMLTQVILHGVQHRSEIAAALTDAGCSPGDLDYVHFLAARRGDSPAP